MTKRWKSRSMMAAACAALACAVAAGIALATPGSSPLKRLYTKFGISTDDRYALFARLGGDHIRVRDTKTGKSFKFSTPCLPLGFDSFRRGYVLLNCSTKAGSYIVLRLANRAATQLQDIPADVQLSGVGRYWVAGGTPGNHPDGSGGHTVYINWHTHETRSEPFPYEPNPRRNLDDPKLGLRRPGEERGDVFPRRRGKYVLTQSFTGPHAAELRLHVGKKTILLSRCRHQCNFAEIIPGLVIWAERSVVRGYALNSGRRLRWPRRGTLLKPSVVGTAYELYITDYIDDPDEFDNPRTRTFVTRWRQALR